MDTITTRCGVTVQALSLDGFTLTGPLTRCCGAAPTGTTDGVACKGCYKILADEWGGDAHAATLAAVTEAGCPAPHDCVTLTLDRLGA